MGVPDDTWGSGGKDAISFVINTVRLENFKMRGSSVAQTWANACCLKRRSCCQPSRLQQAQVRQWYMEHSINPIISPLFLYLWYSNRSLGNPLSKTNDHSRFTICRNPKFHWVRLQRIVCVWMNFKWCHFPGVTGWITKRKLEGEKRHLLNSFE